MLKNLLFLVFIMTLTLQFDINFDKEFEKDFFDNSDIDQIFNKYEKAYKKKGFNFKNKENFIDNVKFIKDFKYHNKKSNQGFDLGVNEFSDMDWNEFSRNFLMKFMEFKNEALPFKTVDSPEFQDLLPHKFSKFHKHIGRRLQRYFWDYDQQRSSRKKRGKRQRRSSNQQSTYKVGGYDVDIKLKNFPQKKSWKNHIFKIKHQHKCASCYAFSTIGAAEISYHQKYGQKIQFSEQEIIDCDSYNDGCVGGVPSYVFDYINEIGISTLQDYPYVAIKQQQCKVKRSKVYPEIDYYHIKNPVQIIEALQYGPVVVGFHVNKLFKSYKDGIFDDSNCKGELNHSVAIIGYDLTGNKPYLMAKNSWGENWGDNGYFSIALGDVTKQSKGVCQMFEHDYNIVPTVY